MEVDSISWDDGSSTRLDMAYMLALAFLDSTLAQRLYLAAIPNTAKYHRPNALRPNAAPWHFSDALVEGGHPSEPEKHLSAVEHQGDDMVSCLITGSQNGFKGCIRELQDTHSLGR